MFRTWLSIARSLLKQCFNIHSHCKKIEIRHQRSAQSGSFKRIRKPAVWCHPLWVFFIFSERTSPLLTACTPIYRVMFHFSFSSSCKESLKDCEDRLQVKDFLSIRIQRPNPDSCFKNRRHLTHQEDRQLLHKIGKHTLKPILYRVLRHSPRLMGVITFERLRKSRLLLTSENWRRYFELQWLGFSVAFIVLQWISFWFFYALVMMEYQFPWLPGSFMG